MLTENVKTDQSGVLKNMLEIMLRLYFRFVTLVCSFYFFMCGTFLFIFVWYKRQFNQTINCFIFLRMMETPRALPYAFYFVR